MTSKSHRHILVQKLAGPEQVLQAGVKGNCNIARSGRPNPMHSYETLCKTALEAIENTLA